MSVLPAIGPMRPGDHDCGIDRTDDDHRAFILATWRKNLSRAGATPG